MKTKQIFLFLNISIILISMAVAQLSFRCGDSKVYCRDDQTCCETANGQYGCCPYLNATCCEDKQHCCPNGYDCNLTLLRCDKKGNSYFLQFLMPFDDHMQVDNTKSNMLEINGAGSN